MRHKAQPYLPGFSTLGEKEFGGTLIRGNPREARPLSVKRSIHLVMRASAARGEKSFLRASRAGKIAHLVRGLAQEKGIRIHKFANGGNHLHILLRAPSRRAYVAYVRALSGIIARLTLEAERGKAKGIRFWDARPYTRIVEWGREFKRVSTYIVQNTLEALGFIPYQPRKHKAVLVAAGS